MSSSTRVCKNCDSAEIEVDRARGITYCAKCGDVLEENIIVSEVTIEETSGGGVNVVGQFVGANGMFCYEIFVINSFYNHFTLIFFRCSFDKY